MFEFSRVPGADYTGQWMDESTLIVTIVSAAGGTALVGQTHASLRDVRGGLIVNAAGNSEASSGQALLVGSWARTRTLTHAHARRRGLVLYTESEIRRRGF